VTDTASGRARRCAVISNPTKVSDKFTELVQKILDRDGWTDTLWLETSAEDPGKAMTRTAVEQGVDLVIAAGGDGTVRIVADGLAGTGITMGLVPAGTGNLLARNLGFPLDEASAIEVVFGGHTRTIDLIKLTVDDRESEHFAVMAGIGVDAMIMDETDPDLKEKVGTGAYFLAAGKALGRLPVHMKIRVDDRRPAHRHAMVCVIGNVGDLLGNITLIPGAEPDDGMLDVYVASPQRLMHWLKLAARIVTRRPRKDDQVDERSGRKVTVELREKDTYQLDGDVMGQCSKLVAEIQPGALTVCAPAGTEAA